MNEDTRVAVCCYAGDQDQVLSNLGLYLHHKCPVVVLSPDDSRAEMVPCVETRFGGERCYIGEKAIDRMRKHLEILLTFPETYFLINDADSFCLTPKIPLYIYAKPDILWTNLKDEDMPPQESAFYPEGFPHIAFHPPWFMSRKTIKKLLAVADKITPNPNMLFIDYWLVQLAIEAGLKWRGFPEAISYPTYDLYFRDLAQKAVRERGTTFVHAVKDAKTALSLLIEHHHYAAGARHE
jgi:hypothetical protein